MDEEQRMSLEQARQASMGEEHNMTLKQVLQAKGVEEAMGFDVPFATFTWQHWLDLQARMNQGYSRYLRAIEGRRTDLALLVTLEMMEMVSDLLKEACSWVEPMLQDGQ
jgi:hypothetical protein